MNKFKVKAKTSFAQENYKEAMLLSSQILFDEPDNEYWSMFVRLCDLGLENSVNAQHIYDYFTTMQDQEADEQTAIKKTNDLIKAGDGDKVQISKYLEEFSQSSVNKLQSISYEEFLQLIDERGSFKVAFEDIMYSTKISLENKKQFYEFLEKLINNNFHNIAYEYLDSHFNFFKYDKEVQKLYNMLEKQTHETHRR